MSFLDPRPDGAFPLINLIPEWSDEIPRIRVTCAPIGRAVTVLTDCGLVIDGYEVPDRPMRCAGYELGEESVVWTGIEVRCVVHNSQGPAMERGRYIGSYSGAAPDGSQVGDKGFVVISLPLCDCPPKPPPPPLPPRNKKR